VPLIRELHRSLPETAHVVYDAPPGTACAMVETVAASDFAVLITEPTPFGLNDLRLAVQTVRELGVPFGVVINRDGLGDDRVTRYCADDGVELLGVVPDDRRIAEAYSRGELIADRSDDLRQPFAVLLDRLLRVDKTKTA